MWILENQRCRLLVDNQYLINELCKLQKEGKQMKNMERTK